MLFHSRLRKVLTPILAVTSGILLFTAIAAASLDDSLFNSSFHLSLINKYGIYSQLGKTVDNSLKNYLNDIKSGPAENEKQREQLFSLVNKAVTPDMVKLNTDALVEGLIKYFSGEARFLPDIYLKPVSDKPVLASPAAEPSLDGIDRISLDVILMYMDRNDLINTFSEIRLASFALSYAPAFLSLSSLFLFLLAMAFSKGREIKARLSQSVLASGISGVAAGGFMLGFSLFYLPGYLTLSPLSKYIQEDALYGYLRTCILYPAVTLAVFGAVFLAMFFIIRLLPKSILQKTYQKLASGLDIMNKPVFPIGFFTRYGKTLASIILVFLLAGTFLVKAEAMKGDFHSKDLGAALERFRGTNAYTRVIAARDQTIYTVEVRTVDKQSGDPVQGLHLFLNGSLTDNKRKYSESGTSNESGKARFSILKGEFKLEFDQSQFPESYYIPASYSFEVKTAGTTMITVKLEKTEVKKPGIAELLILGNDNKPLENLELVAEEYIKEGEESAASGKVYSFTNRDGVAVFKLPEGHYGITFIESVLPQQYVLPTSLEIEVMADETVKYSMKLSTKEPLPKVKKSAKK